MSVTSLCRRVSLSRAAYYKGRSQRQRRRVDGDLVAQLVLARRKEHPRMGTRKLRVLIQEDLAQAGVRIGRDRMFEELRRRDLLVRRKRSAYPKTTCSRHSLPIFKNLIKDLEVAQVNQVWVGDLTYVRTEEGYLYLALLTDKKSRKIVGHHCADTLESEGCARALEMALAELPRGARPIHHSDRGIQYCCYQYVERLQAQDMPISMTEMDHTAENALAERMNGILKQEYGLDSKFKTKAEARKAAHQAIHLYNYRRPHTALGYAFPAAVHSLAA